MKTSPTQLGIQLSKMWGKDHLPLDAQRFALEFSQIQNPNEPIKNIEAYPHDKNFEGGLFKGDGAWIILYNPYVTEGRRNFTIAHELGHYMMHREVSESFNCSEENVAIAYDKRADFLNIEREADKFATNLLMPADDLRNQVGSSEISIELLSQCATRYNVSFLAVALRWIEMTHTKAILVASVDGFVLWSTASKSAFKNKFYQKRGTELPHASLAYLRSEGRIFERSRGEQTFDAGVWFKEAGVKELLLSADNYDMQISIILIDHEENVCYGIEDEAQDSFSYFNSFKK